MGLFSRKKENAAVKRPFASVVIVAAGSSRRMLGEDKIMSDLCGLPVIVRSISAFEKSPETDEIVVVTREELIPEISRLCSEHAFKKVSSIVKGGATRVESVYNGIMQISRSAELAAVHDGARPLVTEKIIRDTFLLAAECGAAIPGVPVKDTLKRVKNGCISETPQRSEYIAAQTPQVFRPELIKAALTKAIEENLSITDDSSAVEMLGMQVMFSEGSDENLKITTPTDLILAGAVLERRNAE